MRIILYLIIFILSLSQTARAANETSTDHQLAIVLEKPYYGPNPFKSQLPKVEKTDEIKSELDTMTPDNVKTNIYDPSSLSRTKASPKVVEAPVMPELTVSGYVWNSRRPQAIIDGQVIDVGSSIGGVQVLAINKSGVVVSFQGIRATLHP